MVPLDFFMLILAKIVIKSKLFQVVVCKMTKMQTDMYLSFLNSDAVRQSLRNDGDAKMTSSTLAAITSLKKLVNHPDLIYDLCLSGKEGFEKVLDIFPPNYNQQNRRLQVLDFYGFVFYVTYSRVKVTDFLFSP